MKDKVHTYRIDTVEKIRDEMWRPSLLVKLTLVRETVANHSVIL